MSKVGKNARIEFPSKSKLLAEFIDSSKIRVIGKKFLLGEADQN